jgi:hypothetical protein
MAQYKIIGLPNNQKKSKLNNSLLPVSKEVANVEAEKGETVVTNMSRGLNNIYEMYNINGKKHSKGGTPLALPTDEKGEDGTSFIFSDSKKLLVKDPALLEYFGIKGKKPKTPAQISKKWIPAVNKAKEVLIDLGADRLSKQSAEMTLDNASFKIAALKLLQESMKGMKDVPNGLDPFFDKLQLDPNQVFGMDEEMANKTNEAVQKTMGGILSDATQYYSEFPSLKQYTDGGPVAEGDLPDDAVKHVPGTRHELGQWYIIPEGEPNAGKYRKATKMSKLKEIIADSKTGAGPITDWRDASEENLAATATANKIIEDGIKAGTIVHNKKKGTIRITGKFDAPFRDKIALSRVINQSGKRFGTDKYKISMQNSSSDYKNYNKKGKLGAGSFVAGFTPADYEKRFVFERMRGMGMSDENAFKALEEDYKDPAKAKSYRKEFTGWLGMEAPETDEDLMSDDFYKKNYKGVTSGIESKLGKTDYRVSMGDDAYSGFEHFDAFGFSSGPIWDDVPDDVPDDNPDPKPIPDDSSTTDIKTTPRGLGFNKELENPYAYRRQDINALNRALGARFEIPQIQPWEKRVKLKTPDVAYVSPERAIAAKNEQVNQMMQGMQTAQSAQAMGAAASSIAGKAYADVANTIGQYADKNVGIFNNYQGKATAIANQQESLDVASANRMQEKQDRLKQNIANAVGKAKDKIVQLENNMLDNAQNLYNLNLQTTQKKKDPYTGLIYTTNQKPMEPKATSTKTLAQEFTDFKSGSGLSDEAAMELFKASKSGKWDLKKKAKEDNVTKPDELDILNQGLT